MAGTNARQVKQKLEAEGGEYVALRETDQQIPDLTDITHIISAHIDFPQYYEAVDKHAISVVNPSWITHSINKGRPVGPRQYSPDPSQFFKDVTVTFAELTDGDVDAISAGVTALGGFVSTPLTKLVTHIVTTDPEHVKCRIATEKKVNCKIVLPQWFDDCLRVGKKISEGPYLFPNPSHLLHYAAKPAAADSAHLDGATTASPDAMPSTAYLGTPPSSPSEQRKNLNAFMGRRFRLSSDLELKEHLSRTLESLINYGGGTLTTQVAEADVYIGRYRDGDEYVTASRAGKEVANLAWLYHVINRNRYTNPISKLLHYPVPRNGIPGFENMRISISNYNGEARVYLENLIKYCGAEFTKTMKQDNTHLIAAHQHSEKVEAAQEWNIHIVNATWIEESYANCTVQSLTVPKYTTFPPKTHLGEVVGQVPLNMKKIEQIYFPKPRPTPQKVTHPSTTAPISAPPSSAAPKKAAPPARATQPAADATAGQDAETEDEEQPAPSTTKKPRGRPGKSLLATPRLDDEKENQSPMFTSSGRASKAKALDALHNQADDIALYQRELKRKGGVTHGGRRSSHLEKFSSPAPQPKARGKRKSDEATYDVTAEGSDLSDGETQPAKGSNKKAKPSPVDDGVMPVQYRMMVTGDERWVGKPKEEDAAKTILRQLGVELTVDPKAVDILVAPKILRTRKFVAALACAPMVVDTKFLDTALKQRKLIENPKPLHDPQGEERMGFKLSDALARAEANQGRLLAGWSIFVTRDVPGGSETYKEIITLNGGVAQLYGGRSGMQLSKPQDGDFVYLISGSSEAEVKLWKTFRRNAENQGLRARIVRNDWLLNAAMSQQISWKEEWALEESAVTSQRDS
jgi:hypothetical protein